jgi:hypothetical protein
MSGISSFFGSSSSSSFLVLGLMYSHTSRAFAKLCILSYQARQSSRDFKMIETFVAALVSMSLYEDRFGINFRVDSRFRGIRGRYS